MKKLTGNEIRQMWLDFFKEKGHIIEPGAPLVPVNDPTLLWINSGVAALKKYFDGSETPKCRRIVNAQKSIRTNDIENVGKTARHHTFFEMLGNFSIGDYFANEAIEWGYELLTSKKWFDIDLELLYVTVHPSDEFSRQKWLSLGIKEDHIVPCAGNFWQIGEGPCGPNTEMFVDRGKKYDPEGLGVKLLIEDISNDRYIEIWNIVLSQYNAKDGLNRSEYPELPQKNIDTGAGLERIACVFQGVETNYDTDLFLPIIRFVEQMTSKKYEASNKMAYRVIADHIRTCTFALADGALFSNEGRGYVLRRLIRRAVRYGKKLGIEKSFLFELVPTVADIMKEYYPYVLEKVDHIQKLIKIEEEKFQTTLTSGEVLLTNIIERSTDLIIRGEDAFKLYDTYGFPFELTEEIALEKGFHVDLKGFKEEMEKQRVRARNAREDGQSMKSQSKDLLEFITPSYFSYQPTPIRAKVIAIFQNGYQVDHLSGEVDLILDHTIFYAESGGQISDSGYMIINGEKINVIKVSKAPNKQHLHTLKMVEGEVNVGDEVELVVDIEKRNRTTRNHSAGHLLQNALREVLGTHVTQAGSFVNEERVRYDFTHFEKITPKQLMEIENIVNKKINESLVTTITNMDIEDAKKMGAMALFTEKYDDIVRVVDFGGYSVELCGGCHVNNTSDIGIFVIEFEESISSGVRRIQASTGIGGYRLCKERESILASMAHELGTVSYKEAESRLKAILLQVNELKERARLLADEVAQNKIKEVIKNADVTLGYPVMIIQMKDEEKETVNKMIDYVRSTLTHYFVFILNIIDDKISLNMTASKDLLNNGIHCGKLIGDVAHLLGGGGGGRPDVANAGGKDLTKVDDAMNFVQSKIFGQK